MLAPTTGELERQNIITRAALTEGEAKAAAEAEAAADAKAAAVAAAHPRGPALTRAWERALDQVQPDMRAQELSRLAGLFAAWIRDNP